VVPIPGVWFILTRVTRNDRMANGRFFITVILAMLALSLLGKMPNLCDIIALHQRYLEIST
jgi:hypothetical protein